MNAPYTPKEIAPGDLLVCRFSNGDPRLELGALYTVVGCHPGRGAGRVVIVEEQPDETFDAWRFGSYQP